MRYEKKSLSVNGSLKDSTVTYYIVDTFEKIKWKERPMVIICPGGGYAYTSEREGESMALKWNSYGYHAAVVNYSCAPAVYPVALEELTSVIEEVYANAEEWMVDLENVFLQGSSAGGHLAATYGIMHNDKFPVKGLILNYPVITSGNYAHRGSFENLLGDSYDDMKDELSLEYRVTSDAAPAFVWTTYEDMSVPAENSLLLAMAYRKAGVPVELHMYNHGCHGLGFANEITNGNEEKEDEPTVRGWIDLAYQWTKNI